MFFSIDCCKNNTLLLVLFAILNDIYKIQKYLKFNMSFSNKLKNLIKVFTLLTIIFFINSCGIYKKTDTRKVPVNVNDRVEKNIQEGKGFRLFEGNKNSGTFSFATSNAMWRASIELLDFTPLSNVDYSGGIIITDWFSDKNSNENEYLKITIKFLSNEIRADGLDVVIYKKNCDIQNKCNTIKLDSVLNNEIKLAILKKAAELEENAPLVNPDFKMREPKSKS